jgi:hypothetical protein
VVGDLYEPCPNDLLNELSGVTSYERDHRVAQAVPSPEVIDASTTMVTPLARKYLNKSEVVAIMNP